jgi:hypothetical protein
VQKETKKWNAWCPYNEKTRYDAPDTI